MPFRESVNRQLYVTGQQSKNVSGADMIGRQIGNFKITEIISNEGGMGVVYLAKNIELNNLVAIKCLKPEFEGSGRQYEKMLLNEGKVQGRLEQHPNILKIKDYIKIDDRGFLIMEYVYGWNLYDIIQLKGGLPEKQTLKILTDILQGLDYVHRNAIVHRDIKSANIMVPANMELKETKLEAKIMDFGIALMMGENQATQYDKTCGTPEYMSKEQILTPHKLDHRTDVYSMGIVLYEMLTGHLPFEGTINEVYDKQINDPPPDMRAFRPDISSELRDIVGIALEKNPDDRFDGCGQFLEEIEKYINGRTSIPFPPPVPPIPPGNKKGPKTEPEEPEEPEEPRSIRKIVGLTLFVLLIISAGFYFRNDLYSIIRLPSTHGTLHIKTEPLDVKIYIDNDYLGVYKGGEPFKKDIEPGKHIISGKKDRYETVEEEITINSGEKSNIVLSLEPIVIVGIIEITTEPSNVDIFIDAKYEGSYTGKIPLVLKLRPNSYKIKLKKELYKTKIVDVKIEKGKKVALHTQLEPILADEKVKKTFKKAKEVCKTIDIIAVKIEASVGTQKSEAELKNLLTEYGGTLKNLAEIEDEIAVNKAFESYLYKLKKNKANNKRNLVILNQTQKHFRQYIDNKETNYWKSDYRKLCAEYPIK